MRVLITLVLFVWAANAHAQDISKKMSEIASGSIVVMKNSEGDVFTHIHLGKHGDHYVYQTYAGRRDSGEQPISTTYTTENGNEVYRVGSFGEVTQYVPHNCMRTVGTCVFERFEPDSNGVRYKRDVKVVPDGFEFSLFADDGDLVISGVATLDEMGIAKMGAFTVPDGDDFTVRILRADYK